MEARKNLRGYSTAIFGDTPGRIFPDNNGIRTKPQAVKSPPYKDKCNSIALWRYYIAYMFYLIIQNMYCVLLRRVYW